MSISTTYLLNVALHAAILSVLANVLLLALRQARHRSIAAIAGLLAVGFLPWLTALRPAPPVSTPAPEIHTEAPILPTWTVVTLPAKQPETPSLVVPAAAPTKFVFPDPLTLFAIVWATGTAVGLLLLGTATLKVLRWRKSLLPIDDASWEILKPISPEIPARRHFLLSDANISPCVTGFFRPRIVLPKFLLETGDGLRWSVRHEAAHLQSGDSRWTTLFALIRCTNWWNPLVHRLVSQWSDTREQLCDLHATGHTEDRADYGKFLIAMAGKLTTQPPLAVAMATRRPATSLKQRIVLLLDARPGAEKEVGKTFVGIGCFVALCCAAMVSCMKVESPTRSRIAGAQAGAVLSKPFLPAAPDSSVAGPRANRERPFQIRISAKLMVTSPDTNFGGGSCTDNGVKTIMREFEKIGKTDLASTPSVTGHPSQSISVEIVHEILEPGSRTPRTTKSPVPFVGVHLTFVPRISNRFVVELRQIVDYRYVPGIWRFDEKDAKPPAGLTPGMIKVIRQTIDCGLLSGNTFVSKLGEIEPGKYLTLFTKAEIVDATGRPINFPE